MITADLICKLRQHFALDWRGIHGAPHWARVRRNGLLLATQSGANARVVEVFAFLHDSCRLNEYNDPEHGQRAAEFAKEWNGTLFLLTEPELKQLVMACDGHSSGITCAEVTIGTCWDADRLDLGRVGIRPHPSGLCTDAAKEPRFIEWAYQQSTRKAA